VASGLDLKQVMSVEQMEEAISKQVNLFYYELKTFKSNITYKLQESLKLKLVYTTPFLFNIYVVDQLWNKLF